ncbi:MAG: DUF4332 domain-containing protein [Candidatus Thorarchaeota archaeon]|nr:DUF4332 domain-containing protein [Candidatus Thorarchaeota archaeon]
MTRNLTIAVFLAATSAVASYLPSMSISDLPLLIATALMLGVICESGKKGAGEVVSSKKTDTSLEMQVPEAQIPEAELVELPIETIEGVGVTYGKKLKDAGIVTVQDLLASSPEDVAKVAGVPEEVASRWIATGRFAWLKSVSEEDAEAIVYGGGMMDLEELAQADAESLLKQIQDCVSLGHVKMPQGYNITLDRVKKWIAEAKDLLS